jgi:hypothetical protein
MATEALGREFDISPDIINVDVNTAGATGKRVSLRNASGLSIVIIAPATAGAEDLVFTVKQHTAASGGTSNNLSNAAVSGTRGIDHFYTKAAATLAGTETWTRVSQTEAATVTLLGATYATSQVIAVIPVLETQLADGYSYVSIDCADPGATARVISVLHVLHDLAVQRKVTSLSAALS